MRLALVVALAALPVAARAADPVPTVSAAWASKPKRERHGLGLSAGFGMAYGGILGLQARYDLPLPRSFTVAPFVVGASASFGAPMFGGGVTGLLGRRHRVVLDAGVVPIVHSRLFLHGTLITESPVYGPIAGVGYEFMWSFGLWLRTTFELGAPMWSSAPVGSHPLYGNFGWAVGWRVW